MNTNLPIGPTERPEPIKFAEPRRSDGIINPTLKEVEERTRRTVENIRIGMIQHHDPTNMLHGHSFGDKAKKTVEEAKGGAIVTKYDYEPSVVNQELLSQEVDAIIAGHDSSMPIAQAMVLAASEKKVGSDEFKYPELHKLKAIADDIVEENDGIILPGGSSIHPKFYGESLTEGEDPHHYDTSMRRTILEFCLINGARSQGKPLLGICRGHQAINVYFGGVLDRTTLRDSQSAKVRQAIAIPDQDPKFIKVPEKVYFNHKQIVTKVGIELECLVQLQTIADLEEEKKKIDQVLQEARENVEPGRDFYEEFGGEAIYDQAMEVIEKGEELKVEVDRLLKFLESEHVVLAVESKVGAPMIGVQFHPEIVQDDDTIAQSVATEENKKIIEDFVKYSETMRNKTLLLQEITEHFRKTHK